MEYCELCASKTNFIFIYTIWDLKKKKHLTLELCYYCHWFLKRKEFIKNRRIKYES